MVMSCHWNAEQNHNINVVDNPLKVKQSVNNLGMILVSQNSIREGIKSRLNSGKAYCYPVQNFFFVFLPAVRKH
jgi:hypothetical protein